MRTIVLSSLAALWLATGLAHRGDAPAADQETRLDYGRDVLPILKQNCFRCHGDRRPRSGLKLNKREGALAGGYSGIPALIPGQASESPMIQRLQSADEDERMPPPEYDALTPDEISILARWINEGAHYDSTLTTEVEPTPQVETHWAYLAPERPQLPQTTGEPDSNPIDRFIASRLQAAGLAPAPPAERDTLARRVSLDLTGMPLNQEQLDEYADDQGPGSYERLVERLLASEHFGERWARHWLDLARYSDSDGGGVDLKRSMWPYRDWVIDALNDDMPFDQFTIEQVAGDLLPEATRDQLVATGFFRNTITQQEGGADDEEYRIEAVKLRVQTTGEVWMGSTMMCAQCHDHKFDPISQRDFYEMYAVFNQTQDGGRTTNPLLDLPNEAEARKLAKIDAKLAEIDAQIEAKAETATEGRQAWEESYLSQVDAWHPLEITQLDASNGIELNEESDGSVFVGGLSTSRARYFVEARSPTKKISAINVQVLKDDRLPMGGPGRGYKGRFVLTNLELSYTSASQTTPRSIGFSSATSDYEGPYYPVSAALDGNINTGWGFNGGTKTTHEAIFVLEEALDLSQHEDLKLSLTIGHGAGKQQSLGRFKLYVTGETPVPSPRAYDYDIEGAIRVPVAERTPEQEQALQKQFLLISPELQSLRKKRAAWISQRPVPNTTLVMREVEEKRKSYVHLRGNFLARGSEVRGGTPSFLPKLNPQGEDFNRLDLARWLVHRDNPLTARVTVNRWWQRLFGRGLVDTEDDFGLRGSAPSHPELLDWLAVELMEQGWSLKSMLRLLVTSDTYRRSSTPGPEAERLDPFNRLLSHQTQLRLEGEAIRDSALVASGALNPSIGGESVHPPQPEFLSVRSLKESWPLSEGPARFRRGLYTWHWRTSPYPFFTLFDGPDGTTSCTRRGQANNALHALAMANDPMIFELAQELSRRILEARFASTEAGLKSAFLWSLGRPANELELQTLGRFYEDQLASFESAAEDAKAAAPSGIEDQELLLQAAAWTAVARVLFNLHEFITRS